jgi:hypothetical protein
MRGGTVSALCLLFSLICSSRPVVAQSNPSSPTLPLPQKLAAPAKLFEFPRGAETGSILFRTDSANESTNSPQSWMILLPQQNRPTVDQFRPELKERFTKGFLPQLETSQCAHIVIFQAPNMDSKIIKEVPREFSSNMPMFEGLPPCCRDFSAAMVPRNFHGLMPIPPGAPFARPSIRPTPNLGMRLNAPRP